MACFGPGLLTGCGPSAPGPVGPIHWAGTETATAWSGYIDGARSSGVRAAGEVVAAAAGGEQADVATAEEVAEAYADWQVRCNANPRLARMLRGWDRVVHLVASDTGDGFTIAVTGSVLADLRPGWWGRPTWWSPPPARTSPTCSGVTSTRRRSTSAARSSWPAPPRTSCASTPCRWSPSSTGDHGAPTGGTGPHGAVALRRAMGLRTAASTSTGLAFAALQYLAAAGLVTYVAGDSAWISILVAGLLALLAWGFFGELNGMFPTAAAIRRYMSRAMDDRVALTITFTYLGTIVLVVAADAFIVGAALTHVLHVADLADRGVDPGAAGLAVLSNLRGVKVAGWVQDIATMVVLAATTGRLGGGAGPVGDARCTTPLQPFHHRSRDRLHRVGGPRDLPLLRLRVGHHQCRGGAPARGTSTGPCSSPCASCSWCPRS